jgi:hypothetical protein
MSSLYIVIFVALFWLVPWNKLPFWLAGLPWFLLAALFGCLGGVDWWVKLFLFLGVGTTAFAVVRTLFNKSKDNNEI